MADQRIIVKRRKWKRFTAKSGSMVLVHIAGVLGLGLSKSVELGPLINISQGGLMVQYIESRDRMRDAAELSISIPGHGIQIEKIPFDVVADFELASMPDGKRIRNRNVKFGKLTPYQLFQVQSFLEKHVAGLVPDRRSGIDRRQQQAAGYDDDEWRIKTDRRSGVDRRSV